VHEALAACPFVVVQEAAAHRHGAFADLLLPAAGWGEKEGTVTNSERRISRVRAAVPAPGEARADWRSPSISRGGWAKVGAPRDAGGLATLFPYERRGHLQRAPRHHRRPRPRHRRLRLRPAGIAGPQQWPLRAGAATGNAAPVCRRRVSPPPAAAPASQAVQHRPTAESTDARLPLHLNSGRLRDQWHGMSRSGVVPRLFAHTPEPVLEMHPRDMERRGIADGDLVTLKGKRGSLLLRAAGSATLRPAQTYLPMHWGGRSCAALGVNALMPPVTDPVLAPARAQARGGAGGKIRRRLAAGGPAPRR
jgi:assimilatory nitrate reductase catalytic subunit